jgi:diguanylate cyclase (GGDEF)-like protein
MERERRFGTTDFLTGLPNSRALYDMLAGAQSRCIRTDTPLTIAFMDCDNFKRVNDLEGHRTGDKVLALIGETLRHNIRKGDFAARLGGDEFALLLPDTGEEAGLQVLTRIHAALLKAMETGGHPVTFSVGAVTYPDPPESVDDMLHQADTLMYSVKTQTKNRVIIEQVKS